MKAEALEALQSVRTLLAYQLTPEYVSELLEPIQKALEAGSKSASLLDDLFLTVMGECPSLLDEDSGGNSALYLDIQDIRSLRL